ncbi:MAG TPA: hypothetical protein VMF58_00680 [Rhizomicrobium sp.]|nr:hypothetical protein [Rhizomicrobium sp.]
MNNGKLAGLALAALSPLLSSCGVTEIGKPLFSNDDNRYQFFPLSNDKNIGNPIYPTDKVKTEKEAVEIGRRSCGNEAADVDHWYANRAGDVWVVRWNVGQNSIYAKVRKSDGTFDACEVDDPGH